MKSTLSFLAEDKAIRREERRLARKEKLLQSWHTFALGLVPWLTPAFVLILILSMIKLIKTLLFYSVIIGGLKEEIILKTIAVIIMIFTVSIVYTLIKESEAWRRFVVLFQEMKPHPLENWHDD